MTEAEILRLSRAGAQISGVLPYIEREIDQMARALDHRMMTAIREGTMTPEMAVEGWMERAAYSKLLKHFQTLVRMGADPEGKALTFKK